MGKGDIKTKRGKITNRSYGVRRKRDKKAPTRAIVHEISSAIEEKAKVAKTVKPKIHKEPAVEKEIKAPKVKEIEGIKTPKEKEIEETKAPKVKEIKAPKEHPETKEPKATKTIKKKTE
jgi:ribosomal small subunit protein bTHX